MCLFILPADGLRAVGRRLAAARAAAQVKETKRWRPLGACAG